MLVWTANARKQQQQQQQKQSYLITTQFYFFFFCTNKTHNDKPSKNSLQNTTEAHSLNQKG